MLVSTFALSLAASIVLLLLIMNYRKMISLYTEESSTDVILSVFFSLVSAFLVFAGIAFIINNWSKQLF